MNAFTHVSWSRTDPEGDLVPLWAMPNQDRMASPQAEAIDDLMLRLYQGKDICYLAGTVHTRWWIPEQTQSRYPCSMARRDCSGVPWTLHGPLRSREAGTLPGCWFKTPALSMSAT